MSTPSRFDPIGAFLIGAAIATGNPALADLGLVSIVLPALVAGVLLLVALSGNNLWTGMRWVGAAYVAFIFLWYEQYKLTGAEGSTDLFTTLTDWLGLHGHEKFMRIGVASCEIIASIFILIPPVQGLGAIGGIMLMSGALFFHLVTPLGHSIAKPLAGEVDFQFRPALAADRPAWPC